MALVDITYVHSRNPIVPEGAECRRTTVREMEKYMEDLVFEMKCAGVNTSFRSEHRAGASNDIIVNGRSVNEILDGLEIRKPELVPDEDKPVQLVSFERSPDDWNISVIEDIPDLLMKNALSKAFADAEKLRIKDMLR